jgi:nucleoside-diphosphate-sugar epimerase
VRAELEAADPAIADWVEALAQPAIMDTTKAKEKLGWSPTFSAAEALRATLDSGKTASCSDE